MTSIEETRNAYDRAYQRHMSNLDASIAARWEDGVTDADLRRYADACDVSREALETAWRDLNKASVAP